MSTTYDLPTLIAGNVASVIAAFSDLTDVELGQLRDLENAQSAPRKTLLDAIGTELASRAALAADHDAGADTALISALQTENNDLREQVGGLQTENSDLRGNSADLNAKLDELGDAIVEAEGEITSKTALVVQLEGQVVDLNAKLAAATDGVDGALVIGGAAVALTVLVSVPDGLTRVVFADERDRVLEQIPALDFTTDAFSRDVAGGLVLSRPISFPASGKGEVVRSVWLVGERGDDGYHGLVSRLLAPMQTGGGISAEIPAGHLRFVADPTA